MASQLGDWAREAAASGNSTDDPDADWIDYGAAGVDGPDALTSRAVEALGLVGMESDVYELRLRGTVDPAKEAELASRFIEARAALRERLAEPEIAALVEGFDGNAYNENASVAENLLFGTPVGEGFDMDLLAENRYVLEVLEKTGLTGDFLHMGREVATTMVEIFADLPPGHEFFEQFSFISCCFINNK